MTRLTLSAAALAVGIATNAAAQENYLGEIMIGGWTFCPRGTTEANGQLIAISQNSALFSLYGTTYGGDGRTTFALPDLRGRMPMHVGNGPGLSPRNQGQAGGAEAVTLNTQNMPNHTHTATGTAKGVATPGNNPNPAGNLPALTPSAPAYSAPGGSAAAMAPGGVDVTVNASGDGQQVPVMNPFQVIRYCVVLQGIFPSRS